MRKAKNSTEVLKAAKWLLENVGWIKGRSIKWNADNTRALGFCAHGAIVSVEAETTPVGYNVLTMKALDRLCQAVKMDVVNFNDHPHRSKKQVLAAFDKAIASTKKRKS